MRKFICILLLPLIVLCGNYMFTLYQAVKIHRNNTTSRAEVYLKTVRYGPDETSENTDNNDDNLYKVYIDDEFDKTFEDFNAAVEYAENYDNAAVYENFTGAFVWNNFPPFELHYDGISVSYASFAEALNAAKDYDAPYITNKGTGSVIWEKYYTPTGNLIDAPLINQYPELDRGCEVTAAAMLLRYNGINADKTVMAEEIAKHENNPYKGFVGDIYSFSNPGFGVYNGPVYDLVNAYMPDKVINLTGAEFNDLFCILDKNQPLWVIINSAYAPLPQSSFYKQETDEGVIDITYSEHSVLVTGYDNDYIYFNDPNAPEGVKSQAPKESFIGAWEQMGKQAIAVAP